MAYADCFVLPVAKKNLAAYKKMAKAASKLWVELGALEYRECVGEDLKPKVSMPCVPFGKLTGAKANETVVVAWIVYKNKAHRDRVNKKIMKDPRIAEMCDPNNMPFDVARMAFGGFEVMVEG
jgi:uncharacterized protein YbaA (DUF1428 family)